MNLTIWIQTECSYYFHEHHFKPWAINGVKTKSCRGHFLEGGGGICHSGVLFCFVCFWFLVFFFFFVFFLFFWFSFLVFSFCFCFCFFFCETVRCFAYSCRKATKACDQKRNLDRVVIYLHICHYLHYWIGLVFDMEFYDLCHMFLYFIRNFFFFLIKGMHF